MDSQVVDFVNTFNWTPLDSFSLTGIEGTYNNAAMNTRALIIAKNAMALSIETTFIGFFFPNFRLLDEIELNL